MSSPATRERCLVAASRNGVPRPLQDDDSALGLQPISFVAVDLGLRLVVGCGIELIPDVGCSVEANLNDVASGVGRPVDRSAGHVVWLVDVLTLLRVEREGVPLGHDMLRDRDLIHDEANLGVEHLEVATCLARHDELQFP